MAPTKTSINDKIEVLQLAAECPCVQVRRAAIIAEDGVALSRTFHRRVITPGDDFTVEDADVVAIAKVVHTKAAKDAYKKHIAAQPAE